MVVKYITLRVKSYNTLADVRRQNMYAEIYFHGLKKFPCLGVYTIVRKTKIL